MKFLTVSEFKASFSEIIEQIRSGEEIILTDNNEDLAVITPCTPHRGKAIKLGALKDEALVIHDDFEMSEEKMMDRATSVDRDAAFEKMRAIARAAEKRWHAEGLTDEDIEKMIQEEVDAVRYGEAKV